MPPEGWTQAELAKQSGVSQAQISLIESNDRKNPGVNTLVALERALGLEHGHLSKPDPDAAPRPPTAAPRRRRKTA